MSEALNQAPGQQAPGSQTALRVLQVLRTVAMHGSPIGLRELMSTHGLDRNAGYRLLRALELERLVTRLPESRMYVPGPELIRMSATVLENMDIRARARPLLEDLVSLTSETVALHVKSGLSRVCVETLQGLHPVRRVIPVGQMVPLYAGPSGKVILAFLSPEEYAANLSAAEAAGEDVAPLDEQLERVRRDGYMATIGDRIPGVGGLSVPVWDARGVAGSITVSGPGERWSEEAMHSAAEAVRDAGLRLSINLGHVVDGA
jgi:DNA-binding IclR family transcriptional regulator